MALQHPVKRRQYLFILTLMGTGSDPDRPALPQLLTQGLSPGLHFVTQLDIELDGTGHRQPLTTDAEPYKALGIFLMLAGARRSPRSAKKHAGFPS